MESYLSAYAVYNCASFFMVPVVAAIFVVFSILCCRSMRAGEWRDEGDDRKTDGGVLGRQPFEVGGDPGRGGGGRVHADSHCPGCGRVQPFQRLRM